jgi:hypothetical protein
MGIIVFAVLCEHIPDKALASDNVMFFPSGNLYPPYAADVHRIGFGVQWLNFTDTQIPDSGDTRVGIRAGGRFGIARLSPEGEEGRAWQVDIEGGFNAQFDADHSLDNIGWDGRYGLSVTTAKTAQPALKFGVLHDSSHVGDEYMQRTGRTRIGYTRHELVAGVSWIPVGRFRIYTEGAWGYELSNKELQKPGRGQLGVEYESSSTLWNNRMGWYAAADFSATEERDWRIDFSMQAGNVIRAGGRTWRFGIEWYNGRPPIGEFFQYTERYLGLGLTIDL